MTKGVTKDVEKTKWKKAFGITDTMTIADDFKLDYNGGKLTVDFLDGTSETYTIVLPNGVKGTKALISNEGDEWLSLDGTNKSWINPDSETKKIKSKLEAKYSKDYEIEISGTTISVVAKKHLAKEHKGKLLITKQGETNHSSEIKIDYKNLKYGNTKTYTSDPNRFYQLATVAAGTTYIVSRDVKKDNTLTSPAHYEIKINLGNNKTAWVTIK